jgi:hypothetical protein
MGQALTREKWNLGWTPAENSVNGNPAGLLRMDNLRLDDIGALTLNRGFVNVNSSAFPGYVHSVYSRQVLNSKYRFVGLSTGDVKLARNGTSFTEDVITAGNSARARFTSIFGSIFASSGAKKSKVDGSSIFQWGVETPKTKVGVSINNQPSFSVNAADGEGNFTPWKLLEGQNFRNSGTVAEADSTDDTFRVIMGASYNPSADFTAWPGGGTSTDDDTYSMFIKVGDTANLVKIRIEFVLGDVDDITVSTQNDYFWYEWLHDIDNQAFVEGINNWTQLTAIRSAFTRQGTDNELGWNSIGGIRIGFILTDSTPACVVAEMKWTGSSFGPLNGSVEYAQINVRDNGTYVAKSACGPLADKTLPATNASAVITFAQSTDSQITERWLFRRSSTLPNFLRIGVLKHENDGSYKYTDSNGNYQFLDSNGNITDTCSDSAAQIVDIGLNLNLISIADIQDEFFSIIEGAYFDRAIIATQGEILISEQLNPDAIDNAHRIRLSGDKTESILWISKLSAEVLLAGTTKNLYEIGGNLIDLPDGTINANIRALGEAHPPLGLEFALDSGTILYCASDGWRQTNGSASTLLSPQINPLFRNESRYGMPPVAIYSNALTVYPVAIYKGQVITSNPLQDGERWLFVYDLLLQYWRPWQTDPICLFTEEDGTLLAGYGDSGDYYVRVLDTGSTINNTGSTTEGQKINFLTIYDANEQPRNRKDAFTLKLQMDTGGKPVEVHISGDNGGFTSLGFFSTSFLQDVSIDIFETLTEIFGLGIRYAVQITSNDALQRFMLTKLIIEYEPRPEQLTSLRILPVNLGTFSRKRFTNYAFVIDSLGNTCTFTPTIDNTILSSIVDTFQINGKSTYVFYFTEERLGTDIGGIIHCTGSENSNYPGVFEFYQVDLSEIVSEKLPVPVKFLRIPASDYGTPNRKRHSSYKFQIDTRGQDVRFIPILDGISLSPSTHNTIGKRTVEHFFSTDTIGIDIGGTLGTLANTPFEFYGIITPQQIEVLPPRLTEFRIPENNYGIAARKRTRTIPMEINTNNQDVTFTPIVDGVSLTPSIINTPTRKTAFHFFTSDIFGVDYSGEFISESPFEFYGLLKPEDVEILPVAKRFDQVGPIHLPRVGKIIGFRIRAITGEVNLPWILYTEDSMIANGILTTVPNTDSVYEEEWITKGRVSTIARFEIGPTTIPFHRYYIEFKINYGGNDSQIKVIKIQ